MSLQVEEPKFSPLTIFVPIFYFLPRLESVLPNTGFAK